MYTYIQLQRKCAELTQHVSYDSSGTATYDTNFLTKIATWLNLSQKAISEGYDFWTELQTTYNFSSADGQEAYSMPSDFDKPYKLIDLTNKKEISFISEEEYVEGHIANIADADEGTPAYARIYGVSSRLKQLKLGLIPDAVYSYRLWHKKIAADMSADDDYPFVDADRYFIFDACGYAWKWDGATEKANFSWAKAKEALISLLQNQGNKLGQDYQHKIVSKWAETHRR